MSLGMSYWHYGCNRGCLEGTVKIAEWEVKVLIKYPKLCTFSSKLAIIITLGWEEELNFKDSCIKLNLKDT